MALPALVNSLEELPEALRKEYVKGEGEYEGKFVLDVKDVNGLRMANVDKLMKALTTERDAAKDLRSKLEAFSDLDPKAARDALKELEKLKAEGSSDEKIAAKISAIKAQLQGEYESKNKQLSEKHQTEISSRDGVIQKVQARLNEALVTNRLRSALQKAGCISPDLMLPHCARNVKVEYDDDFKEKITVINPQDGQTRLSLKPGSSDNMSLEEYADSLKGVDEYKVLFKGSNSQGMSIPGDPSRKRGGNTHLDDDGLSPQERIRRHRESQNQ